MTVRTAWAAIAAMFILNGALFGVWASRVPAVMEQFGLTHAQLGLLLLAMAGGAVCSFPFAGKAVDSLGAARVTRSVAVVYAFTLVLLPLAPGPVWLGGALFLFGAAHGAMDVAMNSWGAEVERRFARRMMSSFHAMFSFGAGIGALSGYIAVQASLDLLSHFGFAAVLLAALCLFFVRHPWESDITQSSDGSVFAFPSGPLLLVGAVAFCSSLGEGAMADWSAVYLRDLVEANESTAALGYAAFSIAMVLVRLSGDMVTSRLGAVMAARLGGVCALAGLLCAIVVPTVPTVLAGFALLGVGYAVIMPLAFSRAANDPVVPPGQAISSVATLGYGGMLLGPPVIGFIAGLAGLQTAFGLLAILAVAIVALAASLR
ncbi:MAG: MFS transporter [Rhizobiaceae bacterium]